MWNYSEMTKERRNEENCMKYNFFFQNVKKNKRKKSLDETKI